MEIMKVAAVAIITALIYSLLKQLKPELAMLVVPCGMALLLTYSLGGLSSITGGAGSLLTMAGIENESIAVLLKCLAICVITQVASNLCYDNSSLALSSAVELCGKIMALLAAMPILKSIAALAMGMIDT